MMRERTSVVRKTLLPEGEVRVALNPSYHQRRLGKGYHCLSITANKYIIDNDNDSSSRSQPFNLKVSADLWNRTEPKLQALESSWNCQTHTMVALMFIIPLVVYLVGDRIPVNDIPAGLDVNTLCFLLLLGGPIAGAALLLFLCYRWKRRVHDTIASLRHEFDQEGYLVEYGVDTQHGHNLDYVRFIEKNMAWNIKGKAVTAYEIV